MEQKHLEEIKQEHIKAISKDFAEFINAEVNDYGVPDVFEIVIDRAEEIMLATIKSGRSADPIEAFELSLRFIKTHVALFSAINPLLDARFKQEEENND